MVANQWGSQANARASALGITRAHCVRLAKSVQWDQEGSHVSAVVSPLAMSQIVVASATADAGELIASTVQEVTAIVANKQIKMLTTWHTDPV